MIGCNIFSCSHKAFGIIQFQYHQIGIMKTFIQKIISLIAAIIRVNRWKKTIEVKKNNESSLRKELNWIVNCDWYVVSSLGMFSILPLLLIRYLPSKAFIEYSLDKNRSCCTQNNTNWLSMFRIYSISNQNYWIVKNHFNTKHEYRERL